MLFATLNCTSGFTNQAATNSTMASDEIRSNSYSTSSESLRNGEFDKDELISVAETTKNTSVDNTGGKQNFICEDIEAALDNLVTHMRTSCSLTRDYMQTVSQKLSSTDASDRLEATRVFRQSLSDPKINSSQSASARSIGEIAPNALSSASQPIKLEISIQDFIQSGLIPEVINSLRSFSNFHLQLESVLLLSKLVSGDSAQTKAVVNHNVVKTLINLLPQHRYAGMYELRNAILMVLRNIAVDSPELRDRIIDTPGAIPNIVQSASSVIDISGVHMCFSLIDSRPAWRMAAMKPVVGFLASCVSTTCVPEILSVALQGCMRMCDTTQGVQSVVETGVIESIVLLMLNKSHTVAFDALSVVAKIAYIGSTNQIRKLISDGTVTTLVQILQDHKLLNSSTRARACNALGNIGCETPEEVQSVIDSNAFPLLVEIFRTDPDYNTRMEAAYAVCAAASRASGCQVGYIVSCTSNVGDYCTSEGNCMQLIADMLDLVRESDPMHSGSLKLCKAILRGLDNILNHGCEEGKKHGLWENPYAMMFRQVEGDIKLSQMQFFPEYYVASKTYAILEKYFAVKSAWSIRQSFNP